MKLWHNIAPKCLIFKFRFLAQNYSNFLTRVVNRMFNSLSNDAKTNSVAQMVLEKLRKKQRHVESILQLKTRTRI
ncbi:hypothetical protein YQE_09986, partial [Dendroctonus ponderosae]